MVGFGCIAQGVLPLLLRHIGIEPRQIQVISASDDGADIAADYGIGFTRLEVTRENYREVLAARLGPGDFLLNLSVNVGSVELISWCQGQGVLYLDACIEPWAGGYTDTSISPGERSNYALREAARALGGRSDVTAVVTHGVNPGLVSHFVKQALLNLAADLLPDSPKPATRQDWARLAARLGVRAIHVAERDTQTSPRPKRRGEFVNTWSVDGFVGEGCQPAELGWGSHEKNWPRDGKKHDFGRGSAIYLNQPGAGTRVRTWTPLAGHFHGFLITHGESISISDYLTIKKGEQLVYRPTVHYAYHPCDSAVLSVHELAGRNWIMQERKRLIVDEIVKGVDELGVLLAGHKKNAYWYGSQLSVQEARQLAPHNSATSLQVTVSALAGLIWAMENPNSGIVEPDELDYKRILEICRPYLGLVVGEYTEWGK
jgi:homospermidine synthase